MGPLTVFVDSSVLIAVLSDEEDSAKWLAKLRETADKSTSALVILETVMRLSSKIRGDPLKVEAIVRRLLARFQVLVSPIGDLEATLAIEAFSLYGKGRGHPAQLNIADCLSYACAKSLAVPLLYKGDDFARTDLA